MELVEIEGVVEVDMTVADTSIPDEIVKQDCFDIQKAIWTSSLAPKLHTVLVSVFGPEQFSFYGSYLLRHDKAVKVGWKSLTYDSAWALHVYDQQSPMVH